MKESLALVANSAQCTGHDQKGPTSPAPAPLAQVPGSEWAPASHPPPYQVQQQLPDRTLPLDTELLCFFKHTFKKKKNSKTRLSKKDLQNMIIDNTTFMEKKIRRVETQRETPRESGLSWVKENSEC